MRIPETIWDWPDTIQVPDGYDMKSIPDLTRDNFQLLVDEHNNLVEVVNAIGNQLGIKWEQL